MAIAVLSDPTVAADADAPAVLTPRGVAAVHLTRFEEAWRELDSVDRGYFATELEQLVREARVGR